MLLKRVSTSLRDSVERAGEPIAQVAFCLVAVELVGALRAVGIGRHILFEGISERGHAARLGAFLRRIVAVGDLAEDLLCLPPRLVGRHLAVAADDDALVGRLPATVAGTVFDDEGLGAAGMDTDAEAHELVVPCDPGRIGRLKRFDDPLGECRAHLRGAFSGVRLHEGSMESHEKRVNTCDNTRKEMLDTQWRCLAAWLEVGMPVTPCIIGLNGTAWRRSASSDPILERVS